jgi:thiamine biosynthesis protein ThiC
MNVKMIQGMVGDNFSYLPRQVVSVPDDVGEQLIAGRIAVKTSAGADVDAEHPKQSAEEKAEAKARAQKKYERMGLKPDRIERLLRRREPERAIKPKPETPETGSQSQKSTCAGATALGNLCKKAALPGSKFCAKHQE